LSELFEILELRDQLLRQHLAEELANLNDWAAIENNLDKRPRGSHELDLLGEVDRASTALKSLLEGQWNVLAGRLAKARFKEADHQALLDNLTLLQSAVEDATCELVFGTARLGRHATPKLALRHVLLNLSSLFDSFTNTPRGNGDATASRLDFLVTALNGLGVPAPRGRKSWCIRDQRSLRRLIGVTN
jgi:hypothetical protein